MDNCQRFVLFHSGDFKDTRFWAEGVLWSDGTMTVYDLEHQEHFGYRSLAAAKDDLDCCIFLAQCSCQEGDDGET